MITGAFLLQRDKFTVQSRFGYELHDCALRSLVRSGYIIESPDPSIPVSPDIVKIIQYYDTKKSPIFVEHLCYRQNNRLTPYKVKHVITSNDSTAQQTFSNVFVPNVERIVNKLACGDSCFHTPINYLINNAPSGWYSGINWNRFNDIYREKQPLLDKVVSEDRRCWHETMDAYESILSGAGVSKYWSFGRNSAYDLEHVNKFIIPDIPYLDPITCQHHATDISSRNVVIDGIKHSDTTPPQEITINYPEHTLFSDVLFDSVHQVIRRIELTDVSIGYILSNGVVVDRDIKYLIDRYNRNLDLTGQVGLVDQAVSICAARAWQTQHVDDRLVNDTYVAFTLTYGEEALIEFYEYDTNVPIKAVHFDLALLSLCTNNLASTVAPSGGTYVR